MAGLDLYLFRGLTVNQCLLLYCYFALLYLGVWRPLHLMRRFTAASLSPEGQRKTKGGADKG